MSRAKAQAASCVGYGRDGMLIACASPGLPVGRGGRCSRCDQLHRRRTLAKADLFPSINDVELPGERALAALTFRQRTPEPGSPEPDAPPWHPQYPACLVCGTTKSAHTMAGLCSACGPRSSKLRKAGRGVVLLWLPFVADDPARYDVSAAKRWPTLRDLDEALRYLERRASAGGNPTGGKVVIRQTKDADRLPERVIRPVAA